MGWFVHEVAIRLRMSRRGVRQWIMERGWGKVFTGVGASQDNASGAQCQNSLSQEPVQCILSLEQSTRYQTLAGMSKGSEGRESEREFKRAVLKLSGEALRADGSQDNISPEIVERMAREIRDAVKNAGIELAVVVGGGNFWRGAAASARGMDRATADYVGMMATVMNALAVQSALEEEGVSCVVQSAIEMKNVAEPYIRRKAERHLSEGRVVIFAAGTGSPFFSTDTTSALRANEMGADVIFKATQVDGVYDSDPKTNPDAVRYERVSFLDCLTQQLKVMDATAFSLCMENSMPVVVFDVGVKGNITRALSGENLGTYVCENP